MEVSPNALTPAPELTDIQKIWPLSEFEYESLKDDIKTHGIKTPLLVYEGEDGQLYILAGFHRWKIAGELGRDTVPIEYYNGPGTVDARRQYAILENMARRQVTTDTKKKLAKIYLEGNPRASDRSIGKITGLDNKTIAQVRADMVRREEIPHVPKRADSKGRQQPAVKPHREKTQHGPVNVRQSNVEDKRSQDTQENAVEILINQFYKLKLNPLQLAKIVRAVLNDALSKTRGKDRQGIITDIQKIIKRYKSK